MKKLLVTIVLTTLCSTALYAQYIVTKVSGRVKNSKGSYIRPGTELKPDDRLSWSSLSDKLWVVIIGKGEKVISPSAQASTSNSLFTELLVSSLHQDSRSGSLSGRGEIVERIPDALHTDPNSNGKTIIDEDGKFLFDVKQYPQTDQSTFFAEIEIPGQEPIIRRLKSQNDTVYLNYMSLITETTDPTVKYKLGYKRANGVSELVASFVPFFDLNRDMETIIANTILAYSKTGEAEAAVRDSVYHNVYANVGKPNGLIFMNLFNRYWQSKGQPEKVNAGQVYTGAIFDKDVFAALPAFSASISTTRAQLPRNFSLRQYAPPVGDQGQTGSCVAWSTSYAARTISYAVSHGYSANNQYDMILSNTFSPDFIYNNIKTTADCAAGTVMANALTYMKTKGDIIKSSAFICGRKYDENELSIAKTFAIKDFIPLDPPGTSQEKLIQAMKQALVNKQPLPFAMIVPPGFSSVDYTGVWIPYDEDYEHLDEAKNGQDAHPDRHAMCVIGYDDDRNNGSFEVMNSWGTGISRGAKGFYWINYDDFYKFSEEVYVIVDRLPGNDDAVIPPPPIKPLVVQPVNAVKVKPAKPRLKGNMEYTLINPDHSLETVPVTSGSPDKSDGADGFANYALSKPLYTGSIYKIRFSLSQSAYVYIINMGSENTVDVLFPVKENKESALVNFNNSTLNLPDQLHHYKLTGLPGKEKMCVMVSKSPIDIDALTSRLNNDSGQRNFYHDIRDFLHDRLIELKPENYMQNKIDFDTPTGDQDVLAFFLQINHL